MNTKIVAERNKLIYEQLYALVKDNPNISRAQLLVIINNILNKILGDLQPALGSVVAGRIDPESYPDAAQYNTTSAAMITDFTGLASWHADLITYATKKIEEHLGKTYDENGLLTLIATELKSIALSTPGLVPAEWVQSIPLQSNMFEVGLTTCKINDFTQEIRAASSTTQPAKITKIDFELLYPSSSIAHVGFGKKFGTTSGTDDAVRPAEEYGLANLASETDSDYVEYEAVFSEALPNNPNCNIASTNWAVLQQGHDGTYQVNFWHPVFSQLPPVLPVGSLNLDKQEAAAGYKLEFRLTVELDGSPLISNVTVKQKAVNGKFAAVTVVGTAADKMVTFNATTPAAEMQFTADAPENIQKLYVTFSQSSSYRERYQLYRYIMSLSTTNNLTNMLSDSEL